MNKKKQNIINILGWTLTGILIFGVIGYLLAGFIVSQRPAIHPDIIALRTCESIRGSLYGYVADSQDELFPLEINDWDELREICNVNGAELKETEKKQGITIVEYVTWDTDRDGEKGDDYYFIFRIIGYPRDRTGSQLEVRPSVILRQTYS